MARSASIQVEVMDEPEVIEAINAAYDSGKRAGRRDVLDAIDHQISRVGRLKDAESKYDRVAARLVEGALRGVAARFTESTQEETK